MLSRVELYDPKDCGLPGSSVHGMSQARILKWVAISISRGSSQPRDWTEESPTMAGGFFTTEPPGKPGSDGAKIVTCMSYESLLLLLLSHFSRVRLCDPIDGSQPGSPIPGILQARTLEWVAISFSNA